MLKGADSYMLLHDVEEDHPDYKSRNNFAGPNHWPEIKDFKEALLEYRKSITETALKITKHIANTLDMPTVDLLRAFENPSTYLRLFCYEPPKSDSFNFKPHKDYGFINLISDDQPGYYLFDQTDQPTLIELKENELLITGGELLEIFSNKKLKAAKHAVRSPQKANRHSISFFLDPNMDYKGIVDYADHINHHVYHDYLR